MKKIIFFESLILMLFFTVLVYQSKNPKIIHDVKTEKEYVDKEILISSDYNCNHYTYCNLSVTPILQNPELPTGCEITSLTTVLNYYGFSVDKLFMAENYLKTGDIGITNPDIAFVGTPFSEYSFGCFSNVIKESATNYLGDNNSALSVIDLNGYDFYEFKKYILDGHPIIFWATIELREPYVSCSWNIDNQEIDWLANEHCMVLIGFNNENSNYIVSDPLQGIVEYPEDLLIERYNQMGKQALLIN